MTEKSAAPRMRMVNDSIEFTFPKSEAERFTEAARLHVVCPLHEDELLIDYCINARGEEWTENPRGYRTENVASPGTIDSMKRAMARGKPVLFSLPDAEHEPGDEPHLRGRFECPRPSCAVDMQVRHERLNALTTAFLTKMLAAGIPEMTVTNVDAPAWRVVRDK